MEKVNKKYWIIGIVTTLIIAVSATTFAYWRGSISGVGEKMSMNFGQVYVLFTDKTSLTGEGEIKPGWNVSKTFTIENQGGQDYEYDILIEDLINTFVLDNGLQYKITSTNNGYSMEEYADVPKSNSLSDVILAYSVVIPSNVTQEYTIEFRYYDNPNMNQSEDMNKTFSGTLAIHEGSVDPNVFYSVTLNVENATVDTNIKETIKKGSVEFNVTPLEGYTLGSNVTCDNNASGIIENGKVTISNVTTDTICELNNDINTYEITMNVVNGKSNALNKIVEFNENAEFTITPNTGYTLTGATLEGDNCSIEGNIVTVSNVKSNGTCTLTLPKDKYQVILTGNNVTVSDSPKEVEYEGSTTFNVTPSTGFTMSEASVNCDGGASTNINGNQVTISNVLKGQTCTITPKQITYEVELVVVNGTGNTTKTIAHGGSDTFNISANSTYTLDNPTISCTGSASTSYNNGELTISNVTGEQTCTVTLKHTSYLVKFTSGTGGSNSPTNQTVTHGNSASTTYSTSSYYYYSSTSCVGDITGTSYSVSRSGSTLTLSNVIEDTTCSISYYYNRPSYTVTVNVTGGSASPSSTTVYSGGSATFTITPSSGYSLDGAEVSGTGCSLSGSKVTVSNVTGNRKCSIILRSERIIRYTIVSSQDYARVDRYVGWYDTNHEWHYATSTGTKEFSWVIPCDAVSPQKRIVGNNCDDYLTVEHGVVNYEYNDEGTSSCLIIFDDTCYDASIVER